VALPLQVLGFGAIAIDELIYVDRPLAEGKGRVVKRLVSHGGNVATALAAVAVLGGRAGFIGWLGDRPTSVASAQALEEFGVDTSLAPRAPEAGPIRSVITVGSDGGRFIAYDDDVLLGTSDAPDDAVFARSNVLIVDGYAIRCLAAVARARALGVQIVADIEWSTGPASVELMRLSDHLVVPRGFACAMTGETEPEAMLAALWTERRAAVVVTDGGAGAFVRGKDDPAPWHVPAFPVKAVDTTGAGDCFHGAYAFALVRRMGVVEAARFASAAAAISTTGPGGQGALPSYQACRDLMEAAGAPVAARLEHFPSIPARSQRR
jgi:sugar/nucleoside kinase (ribokinase family)